MPIPSHSLFVGSKGGPRGLLQTGGSNESTQSVQQHIWTQSTHNQYSSTSEHKAHTVSTAAHLNTKHTQSVQQHIWTQSTHSQHSSTSEHKAHTISTAAHLNTKHTQSVQQHIWTQNMQKTRLYTQINPSNQSTKRESAFA